MKDVGTSNEVTFQGSPYNAYTLLLHTQVTLSKSLSEAIAMPIICSLIQHGFLPVFSIAGKIILYSNTPYPGDFVTKVKHINSQSDLISLLSFAGLFYLKSDPLSTSFSSEILVFSTFTISAKLIPVTYAEISPVCTSFQ